MPASAFTSEDARTANLSPGPSAAVSVSATASSTLAGVSDRLRIVCTVASEVTARAPVTWVGRNENTPSPVGGSTSATRSRRLHESAVRRPSGLSAGTSPAFVMRSTIGSPGRAPRLSASGRLMATALASGGLPGSVNPSASRSSQASKVARTVLPARSPSAACSDTSSTTAGSRWPDAADPVACDRSRFVVSVASSASKNPSDSTAAWMPPRRAIASCRRPRVSESPTPSAPAMVAATIPQAAANAARCGHHCRPSRRATPPRDRMATAGDR